MSWQSSLPPLYQKWSEDFLENPLPSESKTTCDDCIMCKPSPGTIQFNAVTKCCTYLPEIPNFLAGGILSDDSEESAWGRDTFEKRIQAQAGVTPLGVGPTSEFSAVYGQNGFGFGQAEGLACPHLHTESGQCGIWKYRESTCCTWFCKYERGALSNKFWTWLYKTLKQTEQDLSIWCAGQLDIGSYGMRYLLHSNTHETQTHSRDMADLPTLKAIWGEWWDRKEEFYKKSYELVHALTWDDVVGITGPQAHANTKLMNTYLDEVHFSSHPKHLWAGKFEIAHQGKDRSFLRTSNQYDPIEIDNEILNVLGHFDGRETAVVIDEIRKNKSIEISHETLRSLSDFNILTSTET
ncbi:MAG: hypothetical protein JKX97_00800 [Candidatus Lindowbacteria bacterium]|nr:hypothetical protein [Candidatus Lindowbacteria bacterium]